LGYKDDGCEEGVQDAEYVSPEFGGAGEHYTQSERDEGEVCCDGVSNIEYDAVGEDREEWGEAFDCVDEGDGYFGGCGRGEKVTANLEGCEWKCGHYDFPCWGSNAVSKGGDGVFERGEDGGQPGEEYTECCDKGELDEGKCCWLGEGIEDGFGGRIGKGTREIPNNAEGL